MDKIAVLIPCYNESKTIRKVVEDFHAALPEAVIYVYDNNSSDKTDEIAREAGATVRYEPKQGKGNVIRRMFREINALCYIMVDGDDTYPAGSAGEMCDEVLKNGMDMVIGDRLSSTYFKENKRAFHNAGNKLVRFMINSIFKSKIRDIMTGYRAFGYSFVKTFPVLSKGFEIETEMTIHALDKNMNIKNVTVEYRDRPRGSESKLNTFSDGAKVIKTVFNLYRNYLPLSFFTFFAAVFFLISLGFLIPVLIEYFSTGLLLRFPTFFASGVFIVISLLSFFVGLILDTIVGIERRNFEIKLMECKTNLDNILNNLKE